MVVLVDNSVVAVAHVLSDGEIQAFLAVLLVGGPHRRSGIGAHLLREVFGQAGARRMDLISCADAFYETLGFRHVSGFRISANELR